MTFEKNNVNDQSNDSSIFNEMDVTECFCKIGSVIYPDDILTIKYGAINYIVAYKEIVNFNRNYNGLLDSINPYINHKTFKIIYRMYIFYTRYQRYYIGIGAQAIQPNFKFKVADIICHALVLTRRIISQTYLI